MKISQRHQNYPPCMPATWRRFLVMKAVFMKVGFRNVDSHPGPPRKLWPGWLVEHG